MNIQLKRLERRRIQPHDTKEKTENKEKLTNAQYKILTDLYQKVKDQPNEKQLETENT